MMQRQAAVYARVSSERQAEAKTIQSQLAALRERLALDGLVVPEERQFVDEGYSGTTLARPGLEHLRDLAGAGGLDVLYVHSPDRLARKYAYQVLLVEECMSAGVQVIFLNREVGQKPEDELLLQVQGIVAEYERATFMERSRRGKRHAAQAGLVSVLANAPYGYRYVGKQEGAERPHYEIVDEEARIVQQIFDWVGNERVTLGEVCRRLTKTNIPTRRGKPKWDRSVVWGMLKNPAYIGTAIFGRTRRGPWQAGLRDSRGHSGPPRNAATPLEVPKAEWTLVPVPALVDQEVFEAVAEQLEENRLRARQAKPGARHLLQGLAVCKQGGYAYYGTLAYRSKKEYGYYRCIGTEAYRFGGERKCDNLPVYKDVLEDLVWQRVRGLLENTSQLEEEYQRRLKEVTSRSGKLSPTSLEAHLAKLRQGVSRLRDSYAEGLIDKSEFEPRLRRQRQRIGEVEEQQKQLADEATLHNELRLIIGRLEDFAMKVRENLDQASWLDRRDILRTLVKRVEIGRTHVTIVFRVGPSPGMSNPNIDLSQHCWQRVDIPTGEHKASDACYFFWNWWNRQGFE
jgi:site-specific DNA recombinase